MQTEFKTLCQPMGGNVRVKDGDLKDEIDRGWQIVNIAYVSEQPYEGTTRYILLQRDVVEKAE